MLLCPNQKFRTADSCPGWSCEINGQFCPADRQGSHPGGFLL